MTPPFPRPPLHTRSGAAADRQPLGRAPFYFGRCHRSPGERPTRLDGIPVLVIDGESRAAAAMVLDWVRLIQAGATLIRSTPSPVPPSEFNEVMVFDLAPAADRPSCDGHAPCPGLVYLVSATVDRQIIWLQRSTGCSTLPVTGRGRQHERRRSRPAMPNITAVAKQFFEACEAGKGWEICQAYCAPDASFSAQAGTVLVS